MKHDDVNPAVSETLRDAMKGKPAKQFTAAERQDRPGDQRSIPNVECQSVDAARSRLEGAGFEVDVDRPPVDSKCPAGTVAGTSPDGRTIKGGVVVIQISNGKGGGTPTPGGNGPAGPVTADGPNVAATGE